MDDVHGSINILAQNSASSFLMCGRAARVGGVQVGNLVTQEAKIAFLFHLRLVRAGGRSQHGYAMTVTSKEMGFIPRQTASPTGTVFVMIEVGNQYVRIGKQ